jgi:hypothetical protein
VTLGSTERGDHDAGITTLRALAIALDVPLAILVGGDFELARLVVTSTRQQPAAEPERSQGLSSQLPGPAAVKRIGGGEDGTGGETTYGQSHRGSAR